MTLETVDLSKNPFWTAIQIAQAYNARLMEFGAINIGAVFKYAENLSRANSPQEFADIVVDNVRDQFETMTEQIEELSAFVQKAALEKETECSLGD